MKKIIVAGLIIFSALFLSTSYIAYAQGDMKVESVDTALFDILKNHNVAIVQELNFSKISDGEWERLGDAVMEVQHPGQAHKVMDQMMGGEGSNSLRRVHINMGKAYLGYGGNYGYGMMGFGSMMGYGTNSGVYGALGGLTWVALIAFLVARCVFLYQTGE